MINKLQKGQSPTLVDTDKGNEIIENINALSSMKVVRGGSDSFEVSKSNSVLTLQETPSNIGEELKLWICHDNEAKEVTFYVKELP
nr:hypothetical protein [uncultured Mediterranean phage uvMED]